MERPSLYLQCKNCFMQFESLEQLNTHTAKFCVGTDYADYNKLQKTLNQALKETKEAPLNYAKSIQNAENFLETVSKNQFKSPLNLYQLGQDIASKQTSFNAAAVKVLNKEEALKNELEKLTNGLNKDDSELLKIMTELEDKRLAEVKANKEKELVSRALKDLDRRNLNALEYQKKMQTKVLSEQREILKKKEDEVFEDLKKMQARLLEDERITKIEKEKIGSNIVTVKDVNHELAQKRLEELSNIRGTDIAALKEKKEILYVEKEKIDDEIRLVQKGDLLRKNNSGISAGGTIMGPLTPLKLEDKRNLPDEVIKQNEKWKEEYEKLEIMKKKHEEYIKNEPRYDIKPSQTDIKPRFPEEMKNMIGFYDTKLQPTQKARVLEYIKEDLETKDLKIKKPSQSPIEYKPNQDPNHTNYNTAKYKLSSEPYSQNLPLDPKENSLYTQQAYSKYQQEATENYNNKNNYPDNTGLKKNSKNPDRQKTTPDLGNNTNQYPYPWNPYFPYPYNPYEAYNPTPVPNPETEKLKQELESLQALIKKKKTKPNLKALDEALNLPLNSYNEKMLPEERLLNSINQQEREEIKIISMLPKDSELHQAKLNHFKEISQIRMRMEASLQELTLQRMRRNMNYEQILDEKRLNDEIWKEDQRKLQIINNISPSKPNYYEPNKQVYKSNTPNIRTPQQNVENIKKSVQSSYKKDQSVEYIKNPVQDDYVKSREMMNIQDLNKKTPNVVNSRPRSIEEPFLENLKVQYDDEKLFKKGDGIDFYVDGARFLPDNASCTKIVVKTFTASLESVGPAVGGLSTLLCPAYSPVYGFRTEFRTPTFDPTTLVIVTVVTIDTSNNEVRIIGYSAINLFMHKYRKNQPTDAADQDFVLNSGAFQLPIHCQEPFRRVPFNLQTFNNLEILPCSTLLVRIREAPKAQQGVKVLSIENTPKSDWYVRGVIVPSPKYEDKVYNTSYCMPGPAEKALYKERIKRSSPTVLEITKKIIQQIDYQPDLTEDIIADWINDKLNIDPRTPFINLKYFAKYSSVLGFKVSIDAIHHVPKPKPHVVLFSINPPGSFYTQSVISQDIQVADKYDWNSSIDTPVFLDGFQSYTNIPFSPYVNIIIDLRAVNLDKKLLEPVGWTVLPVFYEDGFVKSGMFQIPFFAGPVPVNILAEIASTDPWEFMLSSAQKPGGISFLNPVSVLLRIVDCQREGHFDSVLDLDRIDYSYIPPSLLAKFSYNSASFQKNQNGSNMRKTIPNGLSPVNYGKIIHEIVVNSLDLPHL